MAQRLRSVFFGTPSFAVPSLQAAAQHTDLGFVVTQPDRPRGRGQKVLPCEVKAAASALGKKCYSPESLRKDSPELSELKNALAEFAPDLFLVTAYGNLLPQNFLDCPKIGSINVHASLLPRWRGAAPIQRSIEAGDLETGVCLQKMVMALDAGDILSEQRTSISNLSAAELFVLLSNDGGNLLANFLSKFAGNTLTGTKQDDSKVTIAKKLSKEEGFWSPLWSASETHNRVRAFNPWPGVKAKIESGPELKLIQTSIKDLPLEPTKDPGELFFFDGKVAISHQSRTGELFSWVWLETIQIPGKPPQKAVDVLRSLFHSKTGQTPPKLIKAEQ